MESAKNYYFLIKILPCYICAVIFQNCEMGFLLSDSNCATGISILICRIQLRFKILNNTNGWLLSFRIDASVEENNPLQLIIYSWASVFVLNSESIIFHHSTYISTGLLYATCATPINIWASGKNEKHQKHKFPWF